MSEPSRPLGKQLLAALTQEQVERLLDVVARAGALDGLDESLRAVDPDLAQTVRALVGPGGAVLEGSQQAGVSNQKALETWNGLWGDWEVQFFVALQEEFWREIHARLNEDEFTEVREDTCSVWHRIHHHLEQRFDPSAYLQSCEMHLPSDWHYGEALIADALARKDFAQAERWMERTFASFVRWPEDEVWLPEDSLLPLGGHYHYGLAGSDDAAEFAGAVGEHRCQGQNAGPRGKLPVAALCTHLRF